MQNGLAQAETVRWSPIKRLWQEFEERIRESGLSPGSRKRKEGMNGRHIKEESKELVN